MGDWTWVMPNEIIESVCQADWLRLYRYTVCALQHVSSFEEIMETAIFVDLKYLCHQHFDAEYVC